MVRLTEVYATAPVPPSAERAFAEIGPIQVLRSGWPDLPRAEVLLVRGEEVDAATIERAESLRVIARTGSGLDNVDVEAAQARGIPVIYAPSAGARPVAEGAIALIMAAMKRVGELRQVLREGTWPERYQVEILDLEGSTLGIVGYGRIGREVAELARRLGMNVIAHDPEAAQRSASPEVEFLPLLALMERSDVVSLHCPLTAATRGLVDRSVLAAAKRGAIFVNVARGEIVAGDDLLYQALCEGLLSAIALDVFAEEPPAADSPLLADPRVIASPHSIGLTRAWNDRVFSALAADVERFLAGAAPENVAAVVAADPAQRS